MAVLVEGTFLGVQIGFIDGLSFDGTCSTCSLLLNLVGEGLALGDETLPTSFDLLPFGARGVESCESGFTLVSVLFQKVDL